MTFDVHALNRQVRERYRELGDRITALMAEESKLDTVLAELYTKETAVNEAIAGLQKVEMPTQVLTTTLNAIRATKAAPKERLASVLEELKLVRASYKYLDIARDGLHFACFSESELNRFDAEKVRDVGATQVLHS